MALLRSDELLVDRSVVPPKRGTEDAPRLVHLSGPERVARSRNRVNGATPGGIATRSRVVQRGDAIGATRPHCSAGRAPADQQAP
jgi:hypothetical protein